MYPISFENPNRRASGFRHARSFSDTAIGGSDTAIDGDLNTEPRQEPAASPTDRLLVVECRMEDRWRVVLCTGMEDLDAALDTVRQQEKSDDVDEVCLTIEVSGAQGRESRREVLRFTKDPDQKGKSVSRPVAETTAPAESISTGPVKKPAATDEAGLFQSAWTDDTDAMTISASETNTVKDDTSPAFLKAPFGDMPKAPPEPVHTEVHTEQHDPQPGQADKNDICDIHADTEADIESDEPAPRSGKSYDPDTFVTLRHASQSYTSRGHGWIDDLLDRRDRGMSTIGIRHDTLYDLDHGDHGDDDNPDRLDVPIFVRENSTTAKILVFAGSVALLVLGGALAELLTVDITSAANAEFFFLN